LAPLAASENKSNKIYDYLRYLEQQKNNNELGRLLYVAVTRAKKSVHLTGAYDHANKNLNKINGIEKENLFSLLPTVDENWIIKEQTEIPAPELPTIKTSRLPSNFIFPEISLNATSPIIFTPEDDKTISGTIIHKYLEKINREGLALWTSDFIAKQQETFKQDLVQSGAFEIEKNTRLITQALQNTINDSRGRWILEHHANEHSEYAITAVLDNKIKHLIIDRTFEDEGKLWIIDYKTAFPPDDLAHFLKYQQALYQKQLEQYAAALQHLKPNKTISLGLYFPLCQGWIKLNS